MRNEDAVTVSGNGSVLDHEYDWTCFHAPYNVYLSRSLVQQLRPKLWSCVQRRWVRVEGEQLPFNWLEVIDLSSRRVVTSIHLLSPANKSGSGRRSYLRQRRKSLKRDENFIEIDLCRSGIRSPRRDTPYALTVRFAAKSDEVVVHHITMIQELPTLSVPTLPGIDVKLDLQAALDRVYDDMGFDMWLDYSKPAPGELTVEEQIFIDNVLKAPRRDRTSSEQDQ